MLPKILEFLVGQVASVRHNPQADFLIFSRVLSEVKVEKRGAKYHRERLAEALREEIEALIEGELADPRIGLASVTNVALADDSRSARVFVTVLGDETEAERTQEGLMAAVGFVRREVGERLHLRRTPELYFQVDRSGQAAARVEQLLRRVKKRKD